MTAVTELTNTGLPTDEKEKSEYLMHDYMFGYFPDAWLAELEVAISGNRQHNPGEPLHWARDKSTDHSNKALRHIWLDARGEDKDTDGTWHLAKAIWRLKAKLQLKIEARRKWLQKTVYNTETGEVTTIGEALEASKPAPAYTFDNDVNTGKVWPSFSEGVARLKD